MFSHYSLHVTPYSGKVWQGESFADLANHLWFAKLKLVLTIKNLLADLSICQTFFCQILKKSQFTKLSPRQTFPLYGNGLLSIWKLYCQLNPSGNGATTLEEARYSVKMWPHPCSLQVAVVYKCICVLCVSKWVVGINYGIFHMLCNSYNVSMRSVAHL